MSEKVRVIVFGGCGFIGRHIVAELIEADVASYIKVVDKVPPEMAWLNVGHKKLFADPKIKFKSANLIRKESCEAAFEEEEFDWAINAAGETKTGQVEAVYKEGILGLSSNIAKIVAGRGVSLYLEISSGQLESSEKKPIPEITECHPWSIIGKYKYEAEKVIRSIPGLNWIIVRPGIVYGPGDKLGLTPRMLVGAICRYLGTEMKLLWDHNLKMNTIHVKDLARAVSHLCQRRRTGEIFNAVDESESTQDTISKIISSIFNVEYEFCGTTMSKLAMSEGSNTVQYVNEKHLEPWLKMCTANSIHNTPLTPYIDLESLHNKHLNLDGSKLRSEGFDFYYPKPTFQIFIEMKSVFIVGDSEASVSRSTAERLERGFNDIFLQAQPERSINKNSDTNWEKEDESNSPCSLTSVECRKVVSAFPGATVQPTEEILPVKDIIRRLGILNLNNSPNLPSKTQGFTTVRGPETPHQKNWAEREGRTSISEPLYRYYDLTTEEISKLKVEGIPQYTRSFWNSVEKALFKFSCIHPYVTYDDGVIGPLYIRGQGPAGIYLCGVPISKIHNSLGNRVHVLNYGPKSKKELYRHTCALLIWIHANGRRNFTDLSTQSRETASSHYKDKREAKKVQSKTLSQFTSEESRILSAVVRAQQRETKISAYKPVGADYALTRKLYKLYINGSLSLEEIMHLSTVTAMREAICAISGGMSTKQNVIVKGQGVMTAVPRHQPISDYLRIQRAREGAPKASSSMNLEKGFSLIKQRKINERGILTTLSNVLQEPVPDKISLWSDSLNGFYTSAARIGCAKPEELSVWVPTLRSFIKSASKDEAMNLSMFFANMTSISSELWEEEEKKRLRPPLANANANSNDYLSSIVALLQREDMVDFSIDSYRQGNQIRGEVLGIPSICGVAVSQADVYNQIALKLQMRYPLSNFSDLPSKLSEIKAFLVSMKKIYSMPEGSQVSQI